MKPKSHYQGMTYAKAEKIRARYFAREAKQQELADEYGIKQNSVSRIISNQVWYRP